VAHKLSLFSFHVKPSIFVSQKSSPGATQLTKGEGYTTGNWALHAKSDEDELTAKSIVEKHLARPLTMLATEPIILSLAIYNSFVYGLLYLLFEAFPIEYQQHRRWTPVQGSLVFLAVLVGVIISGGIQASYQPYFWKQLDKAHKQRKKNDPEARLPPMFLGAVLFAAGLFMFGGSSSPSKSAAIGIVGAGMIGSGFILIFQNAVNYLIDAFTIHAASAQAANTFLAWQEQAFRFLLPQCSTIWGSIGQAIFLVSSQ